MKGQSVGSDATLLWPNGAAMSHLLKLARPRNQILAIDEADATELLWPAQLINRQARLAEHPDRSRPIAVITFILSLILAIIAGPVQLALVAITLDYNWVASTYLPLALHYIFLFSTIIALANLVALFLAWNSSPHRASQTITLSISSFCLILTIWLTGYVFGLQPHQITLILIGITLISIMSYLLVSKQYFTTSKNSPVIQVILSTIMILAVLVAGLSLVNFVKSSSHSDPESLTAMTIEMQNAKLRDAPMTLSDLTYLLCNGKYNLIYLAQNQTSGLFECADSGDVYSVHDRITRTANSIRANATYLGTTKNTSVSLAFPTAYYLYRSLPNALTEDELAIMYPASTEVELIDNVVPQLLDYWNNHNERALFVNIFYNTSFSEITSTKDFILMAAMNTMSLVDQLPNGNTRRGPSEGKMVTFIYQADHDLTALNELAASPNLYAASTRDSLTTFRHISVHLQPDEYYDYSTLREKLKSSLIDPNLSQ